MICAKYVEGTNGEDYLYMGYFEQDCPTYSYSCVYLNNWTEGLITVGWTKADISCNNKIYYMNIEYGGYDGGLLISVVGSDHFPVIYHHPIEENGNINQADKYFIMTDKVYDEIDRTGAAGPLMGWITPTLATNKNAKKKIPNGYLLAYNLIFFTGGEDANSAVIIGVGAPGKTMQLESENMDSYLAVKVPMLYLCPGLGTDSRMRFTLSNDTTRSTSTTESSGNSFGFLGITFTTGATSTQTKNLTIGELCSVANGKAHALGNWIGVYDNENGNTIYLETIKYRTKFKINNRYVTTSSYQGPQTWKNAATVPDTWSEKILNGNISPSLEITFDKGTTTSVDVGVDKSGSYSWGVSAKSPDSFDGVKIPSAGLSTGWSCSVTKGNDYKIAWPGTAPPPPPVNGESTYVPWDICTTLNVLFGDENKQLNLPSGVFVLWPAQQYLGTASTVVGPSLTTTLKSVSTP